MFLIFCPNKRLHHIRILSNVAKLMIAHWLQKRVHSAFEVDWIDRSAPKLKVHSRLARRSARLWGPLCLYLCTQWGNQVYSLAILKYFKKKLRSICFSFGVTRSVSGSLCTLGFWLEAVELAGQQLVLPVHGLSAQDRNGERVTRLKICGLVSVIHN